MRIFFFSHCYCKSLLSLTGMYAVHAGVAVLCQFAAERGSKILEEAFENKTVLKAKVVQILGGGIGALRGLGAWLVEDLHKRAADHGFRTVYHALMHEANDSANITARSARVVRRYRLYVRETAR